MVMRHLTGRQRQRPPKARRRVLALVKGGHQEGCAGARFFEVSEISRGRIRAVEAMLRQDIASHTIALACGVSPGLVEMVRRIRCRQEQDHG